MAKAYVNKRDKFLWDNSFKPEDKIPVPSASDEGKAIVVDDDGNYALGDVATEDEIVYVKINYNCTALTDITIADLKALLDAGKKVIIVREESGPLSEYFVLQQYNKGELIPLSYAKFVTFYNSGNSNSIRLTAMYKTIHFNFTNSTIEYTATITDLPDNNSSIANSYHEENTYYPGDYCMYQSQLYKCVAPVSTTGTWDGTAWAMTNIIDEIPKAHTYSTTEHVVGTWIDGKPIYAITLSGTTPSVPGSGTQVISLDLDIDTVISKDGSVYQSGPLAGGLDICATPANNSFYLMTQIYQSYVYMVAGASFTNLPFYITIFYTKTTD